MKNESWIRKQIESDGLLHEKRESEKKDLERRRNGKIKRVDEFFTQVEYMNAVSRALFMGRSQALHEALELEGLK